MEHRGRTWKAVWEDANFVGWRTIAKVDPALAMLIIEVYQNSLLLLVEDVDNEETDPTRFLRKAAIFFDGEIVDIQAIKTTTSYVSMSLVVTCIEFKNRRPEMEKQKIVEAITEISEDSARTVEERLADLLVVKEHLEEVYGELEDKLEEVEDEDDCDEDDEEVEGE